MSLLNRHIKQLLPVLILCVISAGCKVATKTISNDYLSFKYPGTYTFSEAEYDHPQEYTDQYPSYYDCDEYYYVDEDHKAFVLIQIYSDTLKDSESIWYEWTAEKFEERLQSMYLRSKDVKYRTVSENEISFAMIPRTIEGERENEFEIMRITKKGDNIILAVSSLPIEEEKNVKEWLTVMNSITYKE
ncbi:MAG: hypothetical protein IKG46_10320 [Solobacterium sp.]|nr:hypothetical protein [Solobacterium sp.]